MSVSISINFRKLRGLVISKPSDLNESLSESFGSLNQTVLGNRLVVFQRINHRIDDVIVSLNQANTYVQNKIEEESNQTKGLLVKLGEYIQRDLELSRDAIMDGITGKLNNLKSYVGDSFAHLL